MRRSLLLGLVLLAACTGSQDPAESTTSTTNEAVEPPELSFSADFEESECEFATPRSIRVDCGYVEVPTDWDDVESQPVRLHVGVATNENTPADATPLVYLEGGPGGDSLGLFSLSYPIVYEGFVDERPMVFYSQRGANFSEPAMNCDAMADAQRQSVLSGDSTVQQFEELGDVFAQCVSLLTTQGVDFDEATTENAARDLEAVRQALGFEKWNLYSVSYGTRLALSYMRQFEDGVEAVVLDSVLPTDPEIGLSRIGQNADRSFEALFAACEQSELCSSDYPNFEERFFEMYDQLEQDPALITVLDPSTLSLEEAELDGDGLIATSFLAMYDPQAAASLPEMIAQLERGETAIAELLLSLELIQSGFISATMNQAVLCNDYVRFIDESEFTDGASNIPAVNNGMGTAPEDYAGVASPCDAFDAPAVSDSDDEFQPVSSSVPALVLAGSLDPITPPSNGELVAESLENGRYIELLGASHGLIGDECGQKLIMEFLTAPEGELPNCGEGRSDGDLTWDDPISLFG